MTQPLCSNPVCSKPAFDDNGLCWACTQAMFPDRKRASEPAMPSIADKYPKYYKAVNDKFIDVYGVHKLFDIQDPSGCIQHASKKLLLSGVRTGGKSAYDDIKEARDTLTRWLELNKS